MTAQLALCTLWLSVAITAAPITVLPVVDTVDHPRYAFKYAVNDPVTHDNKGQWEVRDGDAVKGSYSLTEPDGSIRVVNYAADSLTGFNAEVKNIGPSVHPAQAITPVLTKAVSSVVSIPPVAEHAEYGFGGIPIVDTVHVAAPIHPVPVAPAVSTINVLGPWSLPWDPVTHSYGGWAPIKAPLIVAPPAPHVTIFSKKYENGKLYKWVTGPISLAGQKLVIKHKH